MVYDIACLKPEDLKELSRFLTAGFGAPLDSEFAAPDVLQWKYLDPRPGFDGPRSFVGRDERERIVGHVGFSVSAFQSIAESGEAAPRVPALHMMDWLGSLGSPGVGTALMRRAHAQAEVQYGLGGTAIARRTAGRTGYAPMPPVPVFRRVFRPRHRLREAGVPWLRRGPRAARDGLRWLRDRPRGALQTVALRPVERFDNESAMKLPGPLVLAGRRPEDLNVLLDYPRGGPRGWQVDLEDDTHGTAVLNVLRANCWAAGKIVDLVLETNHPLSWAAAFHALAKELKRQGADVALACGGPSWINEGLVAAGFRRAYDLEFLLRDRKDRLPKAPPYYLTFLEADYAYIQ